MGQNQIKVSLVIDDNGTMSLTTRSANKLKKELDAIGSSATNASSAVQRAMSMSNAGSSRGGSRGGIQENIEYRNARGVAGTGGGDSRDFAKQAQGLGGLVHLYATFAANIFAVEAAYTALSRAFDAFKLEEAGKMMSANLGVSMKNLALSLQETTGYAISFKDAMQFGAMGTQAGLTTKQIQNLVVIAKGAATVLGRDVNDSVNRIIKGTAKMEQEILDELGIFVRAKDAYKAYAKQLGMSNENMLSQAQRVRAYADAVAKNGEKFKDYAGVADPFSKLTATIQQAGTELLGVLSNTLVPIVDKLGESKGLVQALLVGSALYLTRVAVPALSQLKTSLLDTTAQLAKVKALKEGYVAKLEKEKELQLSIRNAQVIVPSGISTAASSGLSAFLKPESIKNILEKSFASTDFKQFETKLNKSIQQASSGLLGSATRMQNKGLIAEADILTKKSADLLSNRQKIVETVMKEVQADTELVALMNKRTKSAAELEVIEEKLAKYAANQAGGTSKAEQKLQRQQASVSIVESLVGGGLNKDTLKNLGESWKTNTIGMNTASKAMVALSTTTKVLVLGLESLMGVLNIGLMALFAWDVAIKPLLLATGFLTNTNAKLSESLDRVSNQTTTLVDSYDLYAKALKDPKADLQILARTSEAFATAQHELNSEIQKFLDLQDEIGKQKTFGDKFLQGIQNIYSAIPELQKAKEVAQAALKTKSYSSPEEKKLLEGYAQQDTYFAVNQAGKAQLGVNQLKDISNITSKAEVASTSIANINGVISELDTNINKAIPGINRVVNSLASLPKEQQDTLNSIKTTFALMTSPTEGFLKQWQKTFVDSETVLGKFVVGVNNPEIKKSIVQLMQLMVEYNDIIQKTTIAIDAPYSETERAALQAKLLKQRAADLENLSKKYDTVQSGLETAAKAEEARKEKERNDQQNWATTLERQAKQSYALKLDAQNAEITQYQKIVDFAQQQITSEQKHLGYAKQATIEAKLQADYDKASADYKKQVMEADEKLREAKRTAGSDFKKLEQERNNAVAAADKAKTASEGRAALAIQELRISEGIKQYQMTTYQTAKNLAQVKKDDLDILKASGKYTDKEIFDKQNVLDLEANRVEVEKVLNDARLAGYTNEAQLYGTIYEFQIKQLNTQKQSIIAQATAYAIEQERLNIVQGLQNTYDAITAIQAVQENQGVFSLSIIEQQYNAQIAILEKQKEGKTFEQQQAIDIQAANTEYQYQLKLLENRKRNFQSLTTEDKLSTIADEAYKRMTDFKKSMTDTVTGTFGAIYAGMDAAIDELTTKMMQGVKISFSDIITTFRNTAAEEFRKLSADSFKLAARQGISSIIGAVTGKEPDLRTFEETQISLLERIATATERTATAPLEGYDPLAQSSDSSIMNTELDDLANAQSSAEYFADQAREMPKSFGDMIKGNWDTSKSFFENLTSSLGRTLSFFGQSASSVFQSILQSLSGGGGGGFLQTLFEVGSTIIGSMNFGSSPGLVSSNLVADAAPGFAQLGGMGGFSTSSAGSGLYNIGPNMGQINFASGGIMTDRGPMALNMYSNGGIASSPQVAMYGEGRTPEAYVPLPDGRSIPVSMQGGGGSGSISVNINITDNSTTSNSDAQGDGKDYAAMSKVIAGKVQEELVKQKRPGGLLY
jgi:hypothetical protein